MSSPHPHAPWIGAEGGRYCFVSEIGLINDQVSGCSKCFEVERGLQAAAAAARLSYIPAGNMLSNAVLWAPCFSALLVGMPCSAYIVRYQVVHQLKRFLHCQVVRQLV